MKKKKENAVQKRTLTENEKINISYHEAGHAIVATHFEFHKRITAITIVSHPEDDFYGEVKRVPREHALFTRAEIEASICIRLAGRAAEELMCPDVTDGAQIDFIRATTSARLYVMRQGMSPEFPPMYLGDPEFPMSEATLRRIDREVEKLMARCYRQSKRILSANKRVMEQMAQSVQEHGTLSGKKLNAFLVRIKKQ